jgi:hypothetical protein
MQKTLHHLFLITYNVMLFFNGIMPCDIICYNEILPRGKFYFNGIMPYDIIWAKLMKIKLNFGRNKFK